MHLNEYLAQYVQVVLDGKKKKFERNVVSIQFNGISRNVITWTLREIILR